MPHTGKPSGACQNCKKRHIKCDERRPSCFKCTSSGRVCSGYHEGLDLVLRDQTQATKAAVQRRQRTTSRNSSSNSLLPATLTESEDAHALCFFVSSYALYPRDPRTDRGIPELLPRFFSNLQDGSPLSLSLCAVSRSIFAAWERRLRDFETPVTQVAYGKALTATRAALEDPASSLSDETLMAVCLLGMYDEVVNSFRGQISPVRHFEGAAALIQRRNGMFASDLSKRLLIAVRSNIVNRAMHTASTIDTEAAVWKGIEDIPDNPATILDQMSVDVANVLAFEKSIVTGQCATALLEALDTLVAMAKVADRRLAIWPDMVPIDWFPKRIPRKSAPESVAEAGIYGDGYDVYSDVMVCSTWNFWRATRLRLLAVITRYEQNVEAVVSIQELADGFCGTIPFILGDRTGPTAMFATNVAYPSLKGKALPQGHHQTAAGLGGWYLHTPLNTVFDVGTYLRAGQLSWLQVQGQRLARIYDVRFDDSGCRN